MLQAEVSAEIGEPALIFLENDGEPTVNFAYPQIFSHPDTVIRTAVPERAFWEKITILHREANRVRGEFLIHHYSEKRLSEARYRPWPISVTPIFSDVFLSPS
jgi:hypothetical protein